MIKQAGRPVADIRRGTRKVQRVYRAGRIIWQRATEEAYVRVTPRQAWMGANDPSVNVMVTSNTDWQATPDPLPDDTESEEPEQPPLAPATLTVSPERAEITHTAETLLQVATPLDWEVTE